MKTTRPTAGATRPAPTAEASPTGHAAPARASASASTPSAGPQARFDQPVPTPRGPRLDAAAADAHRPVPVTPPAADAPEAERFAYWASVVRAGGGTVNPNGLVTVLGVRGLGLDGTRNQSGVGRAYNDTFVVLRPDGHVFEFSGATHPGNLDGPGVPKSGVGLLRPGSYLAQPHGQRFGSDSFAITTLKGGGAVPGWRDTNHDGLFSTSEATASDRKADTMTGVLFHQDIAYSVGCQTFDGASWSRFVQALGGPTKAFSYTLVQAA